jgi:spermidine/putrescine transport system permease protein/putrescine transport system permease protein
VPEALTRPLRAAGTLALAALMVVAGVTVLALVTRLGDGALPPGLVVVAAAATVLVVAATRRAAAGRALGAYGLLVYAFLFLPILVVVVYAFNGGRYVAVWEGFSTRWFSAALESPDTRSAILLSLRIAVATAIASAVLGTAGALALKGAPGPIRTPVELLVSLTIVMPELVIGISTLIFFTNASFELGPLTMFLAHTIVNSSLVLLLVRSRFATMGDTLEQAGRDLGGTPAGVFRDITLPRLAPAILAGTMLAFTFSFDDVVVSNFASGAEAMTWPLRILNALRFGLRPDVNAAAAMLLLVTFAALAGAALIMRRLGRRGIDSGGTLG